MALLELRDVHTYYGLIHALKGVSLHVDEGEIVTLIGANGAGKSTTLNTICGLAPPQSGEVWLEGNQIEGMKPNHITELGVAQAPEGRRIFARMSVRENLQVGAYARSDKAEIAKDVEWVFDIFPRLRERQRQKGGTLSGGEQQMLSIGRALMAKPRVLLMDEPSMGLAPILVDAIFDTIREINEQGTTILLVEQNAHMALSVASRGYVMQTGEIVLDNDAESLRNDEMVRKLYLGEA
ncbi:MAG: ABC transporter ATP-binding protein [Chloroflexota bacterium]